MKKQIVYITEQQASKIVTEALADPELMNMVGDRTNRSAHPYPISTGKFDEEGQVGVGVGTKTEAPAPDLKSLPKPAEIKEAWSLLRRASELLVQGAPKLQDESLSKEIQKMAQDINKLIMDTNAKLNVNEMDLSF